MIDWFKSVFRQYGWFALVFGFIAGMIPTAYLLAPRTGVGFMGWVEVLGTTNSLLLSLILVFLYREMNETQNRQTDLMDQQKRLLEREQEPVIEIHGCSVENDATETRLVVDVANKGSSPIRNLSLGIDLVLYGMDATKIGLSTEKPVVYDGDEWVVEPRDVQFRRRNETDAVGATHLESGETATLVAPVTFDLQGGESERLATASFPEVVELFGETSIGMVKFHGSLLYTDWSGHPRGRQLDSGKAELDSFETLDELLASDRPHTELPRDFLSGNRQTPIR